VQFKGVINFLNPADSGYATEFVDGGDLSKHLGTLSPAQINSIALDVAQGLDYLHRFVSN